MFILIATILLYISVVYTERRLVQAGPTEWEHFRQSEQSGAAQVMRIIRDIKPALAALTLARVLLGILFGVSIFAVCYNAPFVRRIFEVWSAQSGWSPMFLRMACAFLSALTGGAFLWLLQRPIWPRAAAPGIRWVCAFAGAWQTLLRPFLWTKSSQNADPTPESLLSENEYSASNSESGAREVNLLKSIVKFSDVTVKQAMQPRSRIVAADFRMHFHELLQLVREAGFSRMPVFDEDLDNVTGILYVKDLVAYLDRDNDFEWQGIIRPNVLQVPETKHVSDLLEEFKRQKLHMAIVVDEYGGTSGLVTMEDVLEEILGEIRDEFDEESEVRYRKIDDLTFVFEGQTLLSDVCRIAQLPENTFHEIRGNADTLAGLALELNGDIPAGGAELAWNGFAFRVLAADNRRIKQIRLTLPQS